MANDENIQYCRYCGGTSIVFGVQINEMSKEKLFKPEVHVDIGGVSVGGSIVSNAESDRMEHHFPSNQCQICLNTYAINICTETKPLELCPSGNLPVVIIPHLLHIVLHSHKYDIVGIYNLIVMTKNKLRRIHTKWSKNGINPCVKNKLGYKTTLLLKNGVKLDCWVIIDSIRQKLAYRLVFGGRDVSC